MTIDETCGCGARFQLTIGDANRLSVYAAATRWRRDHQHTPPPVEALDAAVPNGTGAHVETIGFLRHLDRTIEGDA